jgi:hypothetical protein
VLHVPTGIRLDLSDPGYGHEYGQRIIAEAHRHCPRGVLVCDKHQSPLYLQNRSGRFTGTRLFGIHFEGGFAHHEVARMSDEHKRQTEYLIRGATDAGFPAKAEVTLPSGTRPDAVIYGRHTVAIEVQRSPLTAQSAVTRVKKAMAGGMATSVWFSDWQHRKPKWQFRVPSIGMNSPTWDDLPPRRSATVTTGLRLITAVKCIPANLQRCPRGKRHCGNFHEKHEPWMGMTVDDVASMVPAGEIVPMRFRGRDVLLVSPESLRLYEELAGHPAELVFIPAAENGTPRADRVADRIECSAPFPVLRGSQLELIFPGIALCSYCRTQPAGPGGILCAADKALLTNRTRPDLSAYSGREA